MPGALEAKKGGGGGRKGSEEDAGVLRLLVTLEPEEGGEEPVRPAYGSRKLLRQ